MRIRLSTIAPVLVALALIATMLGALALSRPDDDQPAHAIDDPALTGTPSATPTWTATATRVPPTPTSTSTPRPTAVPPTATSPANAAAEPLKALSQLRIVNVTVLENAGSWIEFPPGMPLEFLVGIRRDRQPQLAEFFVLPPAPFIPMTGSAPIGPAFTEDGGFGKATGIGNFQGARANFTFDFQVAESVLAGILTIANAASGANILVIQWEGGNF